MLVGNSQCFVIPETNDDKTPSPATDSKLSTVKPPAQHLPGLTTKSPTTVAPSLNDTKNNESEFRTQYIFHIMTLKRYDN